MSSSGLKISKSFSGEDEMTEDTSKLKNRFVQIYIMYIAAILLSMVPSFAVAIAGLAVGLAGIVFAYKSRTVSEGTIYASHAKWLIRTFWIGGAVLLPIATVIFFVAILLPILHLIYGIGLGGFGNTDAISQLLEQLASVDPANAEAVVNDAAMQYMSDNKGLFLLVGLPTLGLSTVWWLYRAFKGLNLVKKALPVDKPEAFY